MRELVNATWCINKTNELVHLYTGHLQSKTQGKSFTFTEAITMSKAKVNNTFPFPSLWQWLNGLLCEEWEVEEVESGHACSTSTPAKHQPLTSANHTDLAVRPWKRIIGQFKETGGGSLLGYWLGGHTTHPHMQNGIFCIVIKDAMHIFSVLWLLMRWWCRTRMHIEKCWTISWSYIVQLHCRF